MRKAAFITILINIFVLLPACFFVSYQHEKHLFEQQRVLTTDELAQHANSLSNSIQKRFALLEGLSAFVLANPNQEQLNAKFETFASALQTGIGGIRNFALAPDGVNGYVYPLTGNEKVIGHSLVDDSRPNVRADVQRAIKSQQIALSGPYKLRQGGLGLVARKAVFQGDQFWGLATMVIDIPPILTDAGLNLPSEKTDISLRKAGGECFYGAEQAFADSATLLRIDLPDGFWEIATTGHKELLPHLKKQQNTFNVFSSVALLLLSLLIYTIANRQAYLAVKVKEQTSDLEEELIARRLAEKALLQSENQLSTLIEHSPIGLALSRMDGSLVKVNPAYARIIGYSVAEALQLTYWDITPHKYAPQERQMLGRLETMKRYGPYEKEYRHKDGHLVPVRLNGMITIQGSENFIWSSVEDITAQKEAETEKDKLADQLRQTQKLEGIGTLAGGIAHDFNNILAGLYGNISLAKSKLTKSLPDHSGFRYLEAAEKSMTRATALTNQLLTFSKGGIPVKETISLSHLVEEVVSFNLSGSNVKPVISLPDNLWLAFIDQGQIQQVLGNLTINAKQAMPSGGELQITLENAEVLDNQLLGQDGGKYIRITLADNGTGITPEHLERIFEPYFTTKQAGNGLGLATVYSIINKHGGHISVTSQLGKGTTFTLYLPIAKDQRLPPVPTVNVAAPLQQAARFLVMDDEEMICDIVKAMLEDAGHTVETVLDGTLALDRYRQALETDNPFDLVILDLTIPGGMGGKEVIKQILALHPLAKVIVSSGYADDPVMAHYADYGFKAVVPKPFELGVLIDTVSKVLMSDSD